MACGTLAYFLFAIMNMVAKLLSEHHHVIQIGFIRNLIALLFFIGLLYFIGGAQRLKIKKTRMIVLRSVVGAISLVTTIGAFVTLPMADATVLLFTASLLIPALSFFFLKEPVGVYRWSAIIIGLLGVAIMAKPTGAINPLGLTLALSAAFMHAFMALILRHVKDEDPFAVAFYFAFIGTIVLAIALPFFYTPLAWEHALLYLAIGLSGAIAQIALTTAYKFAPASVVSPLNYTGLIWASGFDILIWSLIPHWTVFLGGTIVIGCNLFILYREKIIRKTVIPREDIRI